MVAMLIFHKRELLLELRTSFWVVAIEQYQTDDEYWRQFQKQLGKPLSKTNILDRRSDVRKVHPTS